MQAGVCVGRARWAAGTLWGPASCGINEDLPAGILGGKGLVHLETADQVLSIGSVHQLEMKVQRCVKNKAGAASSLEHSERPGVDRYTGNSF